MTNNKIYNLDELDFFIITHIFSFLDQKTQMHLTQVNKTFLGLRDYVHNIKATKTLRDEQLRLYKNTIKLDLCENTLITNHGVKNLPLEYLNCGINTNLTNIILKDLLELKELHCGCSKKFKTKGINQLSKLTHLYCNCNNNIYITNNSSLVYLDCGGNYNMRDDDIKNLSNLTYLNCGYCESFTLEGIHKMSLVYVKCGDNTNFKQDGYYSFGVLLNV